MYRVFFLVLILISAPSFLMGQTAADIQHFLDFFKEKQAQPLETAVHAANLRLEQAIEIRDAREQALALNDLGLIHLSRVHDYDKAMDFFIRGLAIEDSLHLGARRAITYLSIARVFEVVGDYEKSAQLLEQALNINEDQRDINALALILNSLGKVNAAMGKAEQARKYYGQVLRYREDIDRQFEAEALFNMGHLATLEGNYDEALAHHKKALAISRSLRDRYAEALSLNDIGILYGLMNNEEKSLANHEVALEIRKALGDKAGIAGSINNIARIILNRGEATEAIRQALVALEAGRESQAQSHMLDSYELLSQAYKSLEDFRNALIYKELALAITEFIQNEKHERQLLETQNRYIVNVRETEIEKLEAIRRAREKEIAAQAKFQNVLFIAVGLAGVIAGLLLILYLVKRRSNRILQVAKNEVQKQNIQLQEANQTKDKFFSIISHDMKGPLNSLSSFSRLLIDHTDSLSRDEIQMLARDVDKSLKNLFVLLENLLEWARSQTGNIDFTPEVFDLTEILRTNRNLLEAQAATKNIRIILEESDQCMVKLHKQSINTVVRNLISNAIKFTHEGGTVTLSMEKSAGQILIRVADTGVGMSPEVIAKLFRLDKKHSTQGTASEKGTGLGLILCREFVEKNTGSIRVQSEEGKGSVFTCFFPSTVAAPSVAEPAKI